MSYLQHPIYEVGKPHPAIARIRKRREQQYHSVDLSLLERVDPALLDAYDSGQRVKVRPACPGGEAWERTGRVSITTGPTPVLLLIHRSNSIGSWDTLEAGDEVVAWWDGRRYYQAVDAPAFRNLERRRGAVQAVAR